MRGFGHVWTMTRGPFAAQAADGPHSQEGVTMKILSRLLLASAVIVLPTALALAGTVNVEGTGTQYETQIEATVGDKAVKMDLTGAGLRKRVVFKVYAI